jgi:hypothetical protein
MISSAAPSQRQTSRAAHCVAVLAATLASLGWFLIGRPANAQPNQGADSNSLVAQFYRGKQVVVIVGTPAGGGYDFLARLMSRHLGKHIPGQPQLVVKNVPSANRITGTLWRARSSDRAGRPGFFSSAGRSGRIPVMIVNRRDFGTPSNSSNQILTAPIGMTKARKTFRAFFLSPCWISPGAQAANMPSLSEGLSGDLPTRKHRHGAESDQCRQAVRTQFALEGDIATINQKIGCCDEGSIVGRKIGRAGRNFFPCRRSRHSMSARARRRAAR